VSEKQPEVKKPVKVAPLVASLNELDTGNFNNKRQERKKRNKEQQ